MSSIVLTVLLAFAFVCNFLVSALAGIGRAALHDPVLLALLVAEAAVVVALLVLLAAQLIELARQERSAR